MYNVSSLVSEHITALLSFLLAIQFTGGHRTVKLLSVCWDIISVHIVLSTYGMILCYFLPSHILSSIKGKFQECVTD